MQTPNATSTAVSLAVKYQNPTADQHAAARKIQVAVGKKLTGITTINQPSIFSPRINTSLSSNIRQITNNSGPSVNQLSKASTTNALDHKFLQLCRALAKGVLSFSPNPPKLHIHCIASIVHLATKIPSLRALTKRMTQDNTVNLQSVLTAMGEKIGRGDWWGVSELSNKILLGNIQDPLNMPDLLNTLYSGNMLDSVGMDRASFVALKRGFANNPIRPEEMVTVAEFALQVSELLGNVPKVLLPIEYQPT